MSALTPRQRRTMDRMWDAAMNAYREGMNTEPRSPESFEFALAIGSLGIEMTAAELEEFIVASRPVWGPIVERHMEQYVRRAIAAALADRLGRVAGEAE